MESVYKDYWEIVGGCVDADESPRQAAVREAKRSSMRHYDAALAISRRIGTRYELARVDRDRRDMLP